jgi:hypothetical protein
LLGSYRPGVGTGDEVTGVVRNNRAVVGDQIAIDAQSNAATGEAQALTDVVGIV